ncbi:hypothetical protein QR680_007567 [Steinernema hermaphroditum]|uniref:Uncharacterized protein n=1 Tax=Steinernema hermaphroditum TaxID=289476 RepID=A0AA39IFR2_9BILA|nr:hypothetical protein QR680_007567 [Steinernema hermaphroditum]
MAEQPNVALDGGEIGQRYDEQGHPVPSTVLDAQGNPFRTYELDEYGGYYDEHMFYCDAQGNIWDPSGQLYQATEVAAEQEPAQDAVPQQEQQYDVVPEQQYHEVVPEQQQHHEVSSEQQHHDVVPEIQYYFDEDSQAYYYFDQDGQPHWYEEPVQQDHSPQAQYYEETGQQYQEHIVEAQYYEAAEQPAYEQDHDTFGITECMKQVSLEEPATPISTQAEKKKLTRVEKEALLDKHFDELNALGPNPRRLREEQLGIKEIGKPRILYYGGNTFISTPAGDNFMFPFFFRDRYPGYVRDIEAIEGSFDPDLMAVNPPKKISEIDKNAVYPEPYVGEYPPKKKRMVKAKA